MKHSLSLGAVTVLKAIAQGARYGFDIMDATGLPSGTVYPILGRLEQASLVRSRWEKQSTAIRQQRPPRRYYDLSAAGQKALATGVEYYRTLGGLIPKRGIA